MIPVRKYNFNAQTYNKSQGIDLQANCNGITVINTGTTLLIFNGIPLNPGIPNQSNGESITIGGNENEVLSNTRLDISFNTGVGQCIVIQKCFL